MGGFIPWRTIDLRLSSLRTIWISTTRPDGRPHAVPVWYWWDGLHIYFVTGSDTQKAKNLEHQSWTIIHADNGDDVIILEGNAAIVANGREQQRVNAAYMEKYVDPSSGTPTTIFSPGNTLYRVTVEHVMAWHYGEVATRTDWHFMQEE